jgi:mRNA interferase RelE/StbE
VGSYRLLVKRSAAREIEGLPKADRQRVVKRIEALGSDPRPVGCEKLSGRELYRVRQGSYRIVYEIVEREVVVTVVKVGHRRDVYR